jgi:hypothetical protein
MALTVNHPTLKEVVVYAIRRRSARLRSRPTLARRSAARSSRSAAWSTARSPARFSHAVNIIAAAADGGPWHGYGNHRLSVHAERDQQRGGLAEQLRSDRRQCVNEDDVINFTPSGGTASAVSGTYYAVIQVA